jgi:phosphoglycolate phosphatase
MGDVKPTVILFDLDGTLTDSGQGIANSIAFAMEAIGLPPVDALTMRSLLGPPLLDAFRDVIGLDSRDVSAALVAYRRYFTAHGIFENTMYAGIPALLRALVDDGRRLAIATSKPTPYAQRIVAYFGLDDVFEAVCGSDLDGPRGRKDEVVADVLDALGIVAGPGAVLVGDRSHDVAGAHVVGIACIGVGWGYGSASELIAAGADAIADDVAMLAKLLEVEISSA